MLVRFDHVASRVVNANLQRLRRRIQNADRTRTRWQRYECTAGTSTAGNRNVSTTSAERVARVQKLLDQLEGQLKQMERFVEDTQSQHKTSVEKKGRRPVSQSKRANIPGTQAGNVARIARSG